MKILQILHRPPWNIGGIERFVSEISLRLKEYFDVEVFCTDVRPTKVDMYGIPVKAFKAFDKSYCFSLDLYKAVKEAECDVIHVHNVGSFAPLTALAARSRPIYVLNPHFHIRSSKLIFKVGRALYNRLVGSLIFKRAHIVVCGSYREKRSIISLFTIPSGKVKVVPGGIDIPAIKAAKPYNISENIILYVGRLEKYKNVDLVIKAMKVLPPDYRFYVVGRGSNELVLRRMIEHMKLDDRVKLLGHLSTNEVYRLMKTAVALVNPSDVESRSLTCIEALAAGTPVVANNDGCGLEETADRFKHYTVLIPFKRMSSKMIAQAIICASNINVDVDLSEFDWSRVCQRYMKIYLDGVALSG